MFKTEDSTRYVASRLLDYFGRRMPWQRRLWNVGSILALNETIEAAELVRRGPPDFWLLSRPGELAEEETRERPRSRRTGAPPTPPADPR